MNYVNEVIAQFGAGEAVVYHGLVKEDKSAYSSYISAIRKYKIKKTLMPPSKWLFERDEQRALSTFEEIAKALGLGSAQRAYSCYKTGMRQILKAIKKNPKRYPAIIEAGGLII